MCGILGLVANQKVNQNLIKNMQDSAELMHHRGPDDSKYFANDKIIFSFKRLAIIDLEYSSQPLSWGPADQPDRYNLIFNGEIYNYVELKQELAKDFKVEFKTSGDSEVLPVAYHYWGKEMLNKLRGMFAFAIWDNEKSELFAARDKFGIKPLFITNTSAGFLFGSEKKSLLNMRNIYQETNSLSTKTLQHYMEFQYPPEAESMHEEITKLPSGSYLELNRNNKIKITRYFHPNFSPNNDIKPDKYYFQKIASALSDSVAKHMRADVTVGSFLSGGIDSTAIAALAKEHNKDLLTFTTGFPREGYSEIDVAAESAAALGLNHLVNEVTMQDFMEYLPTIIWYLDEPVADPALVPLFFVAQNARKHVKVVLSGEGADELFGGYTIYKEPLSLNLFTKLPKSVNKGLNKFSKLIPKGVKGKSFLERGSLTLEDRYYGNARTFSTAELKQTLQKFNPKWTHTQVTSTLYKQTEKFDPIARMQYIDLFTWLNGDILVKADKITMANSLELRVPFLDDEVLKVAQELPSRLKISHNTTKYALRMALKEIVPAHIFNRAKLGFPVPIRVWLKEEPFINWTKNIINNSHTDQLINKAYANQLLQRHIEDKEDNSRKIWNIIVFNLWYSIFVTEEVKIAPQKISYPLVK